MLGFYKNVKHLFCAIFVYCTVFLSTGVAYAVCDLVSVDDYRTVSSYYCSAAGADPTVRSTSSYTTCVMCKDGYEPSVNGEYTDYECGASACTGVGTPDQSKCASKIKTSYGCSPRGGGSALYPEMRINYICDSSGSTTLSVKCIANDNCYLGCVDHTRPCEPEHVCSKTGHVLTGWLLSDDMGPQFQGVYPAFENLTGAQYAYGEEATFSVSADARWEQAICTATNGTCGPVSVDEYNTPYATITCNAGYSRDGGTDTTSSFDAYGTAGVASMTATCKARSITVEPGYYLPKGSLTQAECPKTTTSGGTSVGAYCTGGTFAYSTTADQGITACPAFNSTTRATSYPSVTGFSLSYSSGQATGWYTGQSSISQCLATYTLTNEAGTVEWGGVKYNTSTGKYDISRYANVADGFLYKKLNPGYYFTERYTSTYCNTTTNRMYYKTAAKCTAGYYCPGYTSMPLCSSGTYNTEMGRFICTGATYSAAGASKCTSCPGDYTYSTSNGKTSVSSCQIQCPAGTMIAERYGNCTSPSGGWWAPGARVASYGNFVAIDYCMAGYTSSGTTASAHDAASDCTKVVSNASVSTTIPARYIRLKSSGNSVNSGTHVVEIQAFASVDGTGTNLLSGKTGSTGDGNATDGSLANNTYSMANANNYITWDMGATKNIGSLKFAMYSADNRTYNNVQIEVSTNNSTWTTVFGPRNVSSPKADATNSKLEYVKLAGQTACATGYSSPSTTVSLGSTISCSAIDYTIKYYDGDTELTNLTPKNYKITWDTFSLPTPTDKNGYTFSGWYDALTGGNKVTQITKGTTGNKTLYAKWTANTYTVILDPNVGDKQGLADGYTTSVTATYGQPMPSATMPNFQVGYIFEGYYTSKTGGTQYYDADGDSVRNWDIAQNSTLFAQWSVHSVKLAFDANGGSGTLPTSPSTCTYESCVVPSSSLTKTGYTFAGWSFNHEDVGQVIVQPGENVGGYFTDISMNGQTLTLTAVWKACTYSVKYNANGGSGTMSNSSHTYNTAKTLTANTFTRTGYAFAGWNTAEDSSGDDYADKASVKNLTSTCGGTVNLYAKWTIKSVTCSVGYYLGKGALSCTECECGHYCPGGTFNYNASSVQGRTACDAGTYNSDTGASAASACKTTSAGYYAVAGSCSQTKIKANCYGGAGSKVECPNTCPSPYSNSVAGSDAINDCYLTTTAGNYVAETGKGQVTCASGGYCLGGDTVYHSSGVGDTTGGRDVCACGTYNANTGSSVATACTKTTGGYYSAAGATSQTKATAGYYAAAGACKQTACSGRTKYSAAGASSCSTVSGGYYTTGCNSSGNICTGQSQCVSGTYCESGVQKTCPSDVTRTVASANGSVAATSCYVTCASSIEILNGTTSVVSSTINYNGSTYPACTYNVICESGYGAAGHKTSSPSCTECSKGTYSTGGTNACSVCSGNTYNTTTGASSCSSTCPTGYSISGTASSNHDAKSDCKISCSAGTQVVKADAQCTTPDNTGYEWGWYTSKHTVSAGSTSGSSVTSCSVGYLTSNTQTSTDHDASSDCALQTYSITYNLNGGTNSTSNPSTYNVTTADITLANPTKSGYTFGGWFTSSDFSGTAVTTIAKGSTGNKVFYAKWNNCGVGYWCENGVKTACTTYGANYTTDGANATKNTDCYQPCAKACTQQTCPANGTCTHGATSTSGKQYYGSLCNASASTCDIAISCSAKYYLSGNSCAICTAGKYCSGDNTEKQCTGRTKYSAAGASSCSTVSGGYYTTGCNSSGNGCTGQSQCTSGTYCESGEMKNCPSDDNRTVASANGSASATSCYVTCASSIEILNGTTSVVSSTINYNGSTYPACTYSASCNDGYEVSGNGTTAPACTACAIGSYGGGNIVACSVCPNGGTTASVATTAITSCYKTGLPYEATRGDGTQRCFYTSGDGDSAEYSTDCDSIQITSCDAKYYLKTATATNCTSAGTGYYSAAGSLTRTQCPANYRSGAAASSQSGCKTKCADGAYVATAKAACVNVGSGYYAATHTVAYGKTSSVRGQCAAGLTTIGYGAGANEEGDCGRVLNVDGEKLYLRSTKKTEHALHVRVGEDVFYGNMDTISKVISEGATNKLRIRYNDTVYYVYDDSVN